jgi:hypothetical protein
MSFKQNPREHAPTENKLDYGNAPVTETVTSVRDDGLVEQEDINWLQRARDAYTFSTTFVDETMRPTWNNSIRAFNGEHPTDSKYSQPEFNKRSKIYRPKTRAIIRKMEAAAAAAFFSNSDVVSVEAQDATNKEEAADAMIMKELLDYRLNKSINWFDFVIGGIQDAQVTGLACAHIHWVTQQDGGGKLVEDRPELELIPIENLRFDPGSSWTDPVNTSPYVIHLIPMFVCDVKERMKSGDWDEHSDSTIRACVNDNDDSIKVNRNRGRVAGEQSMISDYELVTVQRHIHRYEGQDYDFYTLSDRVMLTEPKLLSETVFHGERPYVVGKAILETHKAYPISVPELLKGLQEETNEIANQRLDNVKLAMNKRYIVKRGRQVDIQSLLRNVPGSVTQADDPTNDIREVSFQDVTQSSYAEQDRLNSDIDDLSGNFTGANNGSNGQMAETAKGMELLNGNSTILVEYMLRTYVETFIEPVLRQLVMIEKHYETDETILQLCGRRAKKILDKQNGQDQKPKIQLPNTPGMQAMAGQPQQEQLPQLSMNTNLTLKVNVGMGATNPTQKIQKLSIGLSTFANIAKSQIPGLNMEEVGKEIFGALGYGDGGRFLSQDDQNPQVLQLTKQVQMLQKQLQDKMAPLQIKKQMNDDNNKVKLMIEGNKEQHENARTLVNHFRSLQEKGLGMLAAQGAKAITPQPAQPAQPAQAQPMPGKP